jgi:integrase
MPRLQERPPDRLWPDEVGAVLSVPEPYAFVIRLGLGTGLRWGEMTRAQSSDVQKGVLVVHHTKSRKVRRIPLLAGLREELRSRVGKLVSFVEPGTFANQVRKHSGVKRFHVHQLRHTFACTWLERGGSLAALQQLLGHSSIVTTQRYGRISDDMVRAEVERVGCVPTCVPSATGATVESVG